jgi:rhamnulokinase
LFYFDKSLNLQNMNNYNQNSMKNSFFAVDLGATSGRTILGTFADEGLEMEVVNRFPNHLIPANGHFYWDIYELYRNIIEGLKIVAQREDVKITSIGIDTWGCDFVMVGKDGGFLRLPYAYRDPHTEGAPDKFFERVPRSEVYGLTGIQIMNFNTLFQFDTLKRNNDVAYEAADKILFIPDALSYMLTGQMVTEYTVATTAQIVNAHTRKLEPSLLKVVGLAEDKFGRFVYPGEKVGALTPEIQKLTGLEAIPVIAVAGHDTASAVAAVPAKNDNFAYLSSGTWSLMGIETQTPVINEESEALNYTNEGGVNNTIRVLKNICGMWLLERCRLNWTDADYAVLNEEAEASEAFRSLINPDAPEFSNPVDMEQAIKDYCHKHNEPVPETRGQVVRCIYESLALRYRQVLDNLRKLSDHHIDVLHVIGGGSRNHMLNQWTANAIGIPVIAGPSEGTAIGNIMLQALASGAADSVPAMRQIIRKSIKMQGYLSENEKAWEEAYNKFVNL